MARAKKRTKEVDNVRAYLEGVAKNLADKLYGAQGPVCQQSEERWGEVYRAGGEPFLRLEWPRLGDAQPAPSNTQTA